MMTTVECILLGCDNDDCAIVRNYASTELYRSDTQCKICLVGTLRHITVDPQNVTHFLTTRDYG
jgi:hypothetical protein